MRKIFLALPLLFATLATSSRAHADDAIATSASTTPVVASKITSADAAALSYAQTTYFTGEREQGWGWGSAGIVGMGAGALLFADNHPFTRGASYPIFIVGAAQTFIAVLSFARPTGRIAKNDEAIQKDAVAWYQDETARIHTVNRFLTGVKLLEVATTVTGIALAGAGLLNRDQSMQGVGFGISVEGAVMFVLDTFAHERAETYESILTLEPPRPDKTSSNRIAKDTNEKGALLSQRAFVHSTI